MTDERDELSLWADDFRAEPAAAVPLSVEAIMAQAARGARRERLMWLEQIGGTAFAVAVFLGLVVRTRSLLLAALSAVVLPTLLALFAFFVHEQLALRGRALTAVRHHAELVVRRRRADVRLQRASQAVLGLLAASFWVWFPFFVFSRVERFAAEPWRLAVGATVSLVVFVGAFWLLRRRLRKARAELRRWEGVLAAFCDES